MHAEGFLTLFRDQQLTRAATLVGFRSEKRKMPYVRYVKSKTKTNKQTNQQKTYMEIWKKSWLVKLATNSRLLVLDKGY